MNIRKCMILGLSVLIVTETHSIPVPNMQEMNNDLRPLITSDRRAYNIPKERTITVYPGERIYLPSISYNPTLTPGGQANGFLILQGNYPVKNRNWLSLIKKSKKTTRKTQSRKSEKNNAPWLQEEDLVLGQANAPISYTLSIPKNAPKGTFSIVGTFDGFKNMGTVFVVNVAHGKRGIGK